MQQGVERAVLVDPVGPERLGEVAQARVDAVELDRGAGVRELDVGAVRHHRALGVGRGELDEPVGDQRRGDDHGLGIGRHLLVGVVLHLHAHRVALGDDRGDGADRDAEDPHLRALVDAHRAREVRRDGLGLRAVGHEDEADGDEDDRDGDHEHVAVEPAQHRVEHQKSPPVPGTNSPLGMPPRFTT